MTLRECGFFLGFLAYISANLYKSIIFHHFYDKFEGTPGNAEGTPGNAEGTPGNAENVEGMRTYFEKVIDSFLE